MLSKIHVNQHHIKANNTWNKSLPVFTVKQGKRNYYTEEVLIDGPSKLVYQPDDPLSCGARVWIETEAKVHMIGKTTFKELHE
jgi:hypothetical protein